MTDPRATDRPRHALQAVPAQGTTILRFQRSERLLHWALALPFVVLYGSAFMMFVLWGEAPPRQWHTLFGVVHRVAGIGLIVLPPLALLAGWSQWRVHFENLREGWIWNRDDLLWLGRAPRMMLDAKTAMPDQGKFNAAEKLNFMMVCTTYSLYIATGILVWLPGQAMLLWVAHFAMAVLGLPLVAGHIFMATINPSTRVGLSGMFTGRVDAAWASHHYANWFRRKFGPHPAHVHATAARDAGTAGMVATHAPTHAPTPAPTYAPAHAPTQAPAHAPAAPAVPARVSLAEKPAGEESLALLEGPAEVRCGTCSAPHPFASWRELLDRARISEAVHCAACRAPISLVELDVPPELLPVIMRHLELGRGDSAAVA